MIEKTERYPLLQLISQQKALLTLLNIRYQEH